jgi:type IV fimbrial biogenesis protein FimT
MSYPQKIFILRIMKGIRGFTLVELMVVLAIAAGLLALTAPLGHFVRSNASTTKTHEFATALNLARSTAVTAGANVVICRLTIVDEDTGEQDCLRNDVGAEDDVPWQNGWAIFIDSNDDSSITNGTTGVEDTDEDGLPDSATDDDPIIRIYEALSPGYTLRSADKEIITFDHLGMANGSNDTWILCDPSKEQGLARAVILSRTGRVRFAEDSNDDGIREMPDGSNLTCPT